MQISERRVMPGLSPSCNISSLGAVIQDIGVSCLSEGEQYLRRLIVVTECGVSFILSGSGKTIRELSTNIRNRNASSLPFSLVANS